jgi:hypothetical protein
MNGPNVSGLIKRQSNQPVLILSSERDAVGHTGGRAITAGKFVQTYRHPWLQRTRKAHSAALWVHDQSVAGLR